MLLDALGFKDEGASSVQIRERYVNDPVGWVTDQLHEHAWSKQREILESVVKNRKTAVQSCHGSGKSWLAARCAAHWLATHEPGEAFVVSSAPTWKQVRAVLWREMTRAHSKGKLPGRITQQAEWIAKMPAGHEEIIALGIKPQDYDPSAFQGIHALYVLVIFDEACHDDQTDVLTDRGWIRFADLKLSDRVLTMNPATHVPEYLHPSRVVKKRYTGEMIEYTAKGANYCVTPDHMMYTSQRSNKKYYPWGKIAAEELATKRNHFMLKSVTNWPNADVPTHTIPELTTARKHFPAREVPMGLWLRFLAWFASEGHIVVSRALPRTVGITQKSAAVLTEIEDLCRALGFKPSRYDTCGQVRIGDTQLAAHLYEMGHNCLDKRLPRYLFECSVAQINLFLDTYVRGDGYSKSAARDIIYTSSPRMADDLQELILLTGVPSVIRTRKLPPSDFGTHVAHPSGDGYVVSRPRQSTKIKSVRENFNRIDYDGYVYCATVPPHHLLLTRRNGYTLWSGNCGIFTSLWHAADSLTANDESRFLAIGNPDDPNSEFASNCKPGSGWNVVRISAFDTPNFTGEEIPERISRTLVGARWVEEKRNKWGETNPLYIAKVLGEFPETNVDGLIPMRWIRDAQERTIKSVASYELGVDVGAGGDKTVIAANQGGIVRILKRNQNPDTMASLELLLDVMKETDPVVARVDSVGLGLGIVDRAKQIAGDKSGRRSTLAKRIEGVNVGRAPAKKDKFVNLRAENYWNLREMFATGLIDLDAEDEDLIAQLVDLQYRRTSRGLIQIESKEEMKARGKKSPDDADAVMLACAKSGGATKTKITWGGKRRKGLTR